MWERTQAVIVVRDKQFYNKIQEKKKKTNKTYVLLIQITEEKKKKINDNLFVVLVYFARAHRATKINERRWRKRHLLTQNISI